MTIHWLKRTTHPSTLKKEKVGRRVECGGGGAAEISHPRACDGSVVRNRTKKGGEWNKGSKGWICGEQDARRMLDAEDVKPKREGEMVYAALKFKLQK